MEKGASVRRNGKSVEAPGETNTLFKKIDKTYTELREQEDQMYIQRTVGITSQVRESSAPRDREMIIKNLRAALNDLLQEAEQSLRERTSSRTYAPAICAFNYLKKAYKRSRVHQENHTKNRSGSVLLGLARVCPDVVYFFYT
jgi:hypothetical protein